MKNCPLLTISNYGRWDVVGSLGVLQSMRILIDSLFIKICINYPKCIKTSPNV